VAEATPPTNGGYDLYQKVTASAGSTPGSKKKAPQETDTKQSFVPKLTLDGYAVLPTLEEMASMSEADLATVSGFTVTRGGVGSVSWDGSVDVRGIDLDKVITIEPRDVAVYDEQERDGTKPEVGNKLNRPAVITMYDVFPKEGSDRAAIEKFERKIARTTKAANAELISYDSSSGVWKFRVPHFSRYALLDDSDDEDDEIQVDQALRRPAAQNFESGERGGRSPLQTHDTGEAAAIDVGTTWFGAFRDEDEEMVDVAVARSKENEESESNVIREAENAYLKLSETLANDLSRKNKQTSILKKQAKKTRRQEEENAMFPDEGVTVDDSIDSDSFPELPTQEELVVSSKPGVCSRIAQKAGIQTFSASSTDYGMRMGRSFRVGWNPNGSFFHLQSGSAVVLRQSIPVFTKGTVPQEENAKLIETHLINAKMEVLPLRECPTYCLAPTDDAKLRKTLSDYVAVSVSQEQNVSDTEESSVLTRAFSLLLGLFAEDRSDGTTALLDATMIEAADEGKAREALTEKRRIDACAKWLTAACSEDVRNDIREALGKNDMHSAIFAAMTGGDIEQASSIAMNNGYLHLATLLATGAASFDLIRDQVQQWEESGAADNIPAELLRIYTMLGGDLNSEEQIHLAFAQSGRQSPLDWRRRLCMLLTFGVHSEGEDTLATLVEQYKKQVIENKSPFPSPRHIWNEQVLNQSGPQSLLYKIIELSTCIDGNDTETKSLAEVVTPPGYTSAIFDFSGAFHVAAAIYALGVEADFSPLEQARVLDSYASQLVASGRWDLAVYVMLCSFGVDRPEDLLSRERIAKTIVLHQCPDVQGGGTIPKRAELEQIGVPSAWFEEALAYRCGNNGDSFAYISHLGKFSLDEARTAIEELIVPNLLFMNKAGVQDNLQLLSEFASDDDSLAATVVDFFHLAEDIVAISSQPPDEEEKNAEIASLTELASSIKNRFRAHRSYYEGIQDASSSLSVVPNYRLISISTFLAEALAGVSFLQLQLRVLAEGSSIWDDAYLMGNSKRPLKVASELALIAARNADVSVATDGGETTASIGSPSMALTGLM
jgi:nuclear pore complex protein Nup98-Nup96